MPSNWTKQPSYLDAHFLNDGTGDTAIGGTLTTVPANVNAGQGIQSLPGDRIILGVADAIALSDNAVGNLSGGLYTYVAFSNSTATAQLGHAVFWVLNANNAAGFNNDGLYQVTPDYAANIGATLFAGVTINNNISKNNYWWVQSAGKVACKFRTTVTSAGAIGGGAYLATGAGANNNNNSFDVGSFDTTASGNFTGALTDVALTTYVGVQEVAASNNNTSLVDISLARIYRW